MSEIPDVCVVGGGPAGLTTASTLGGAGRRVVLLESGGLESAVDADGLSAGDHEGEPYAGLRRTRHRGLGGTANIWNIEVEGAPGAKYVPLAPRDLADWPIGWHELEPFYAEAQEVCGLGPFEYGAVYWSTPARRPFELDGTGLESGVYQFGTAPRFTGELAHRLHAAESVTVVTSATVVEVGLDPDARSVRYVRALDGAGRVVDVTANAFVLACGAVENARLLLLAGLGDGRLAEWLGRCFMEHARDFSLTLVPSACDLFAEAGFYDLWTSNDGALVGGRLGLTEDALDAFRLPNAAMTLTPRARSSRVRRLVDNVPRLGGRGALRRSPKSRYGWSRLPTPERVFDSFRVVLNLEQRPHRDNRIELGTRRDRFGNPLPRLSLRWTDGEQERLEELRRLLRDWFRDAKLGDLVIAGGRRPDLSAHHHAGTTRMALDSRDGVVDADGRVFGVDNLFVAGASVFPSAGFANPTLTVVALARRLARHIDMWL